MTNEIRKELINHSCRLEVSHLPPRNNVTAGAAADLRWREPAGVLTLEVGKIDVWRIQAEQSSPWLGPFTEMLSERERLRAYRYHFPRDRYRFILRRIFLRVILSYYLELSPGQLCFAEGLNGKPALSYPTDSGLQFNLSHSDEMVLYAVTRERGIGIDLERIREIREAEWIAPYLFSARAAAQWRLLPERQRAEAFLKRWTCLEACVKASGCGLADPPVAIRAVAAQYELDGFLRQGNYHGAGNVLYDLAPAPGYVAALACQRVPACGRVPVLRVQPPIEPALPLA